MPTLSALLGHLPQVLGTPDTLKLALSATCITAGLGISRRWHAALAVATGWLVVFTVLLREFTTWTLRHPGGELHTFLHVHHLQPVWLVVPALLAAWLVWLALQVNSQFGVPRSLGSPWVRPASAVAVSLIAVSLCAPAWSGLWHWGAAVLAVRIGLAIWHAGASGGRLWRGGVGALPEFGRSWRIPLVFIGAGLVLLLIESLIIGP